MKTAREVLLNRYRDATPDLDRIRRGVVANLSTQPAPRPAWSPVTWAAVLWEQLVLPSRYVWAGIAAVWLVLLVGNTLTGNHPSATQARPPISMPALLETARAQRELQAELLGVRVVAHPATTPTPADQSRIPQRRDKDEMGARHVRNTTTLLA